MPDAITHDVITVGIPLLAILAGILFSRSDIKELRTEMQGQMKDLRTELRSDFRELRTEVRQEIAELRGEMNARFDAIDAELRYFHGVTGKLDGRVDALEKRDKR
jgi:hypothetical protein